MPEAEPVDDRAPAGGDDCPPPPVYRPPADDGADPVFVDESLVVADKPAGLLSAPGRGADKADCLVHRLRRRFPDLLLVHRLDMDTSGLLVFARGAAAQSALSRQFQERRVSKTYLAEVEGSVLDEAGEIDLPLACDWPRRPHQKVDFQAGKPSLTRFRVVARKPEAGTSRLELSPVTGRSHQLRVHCLAIGHPIVGDPLYGAGGPRLLLHACRLAFTHPVSGQRLDFLSQPPF